MKLKINAEGMTQIKSLADEIILILENRLPDIAVDQCQTDIMTDEERALDEEFALEECILAMILHRIHRQFC